MINGPYINTEKNRNRDSYSFANINLLGKCNVDCFFCLGKDIKEELKPHNQCKVHFSKWQNFDKFLDLCKKENVRKLYVTGQNTDSLVYSYIEFLVRYLHDKGFLVGLRTNGYNALEHMKTINKCDLSIGYSIHSLSPITNRMIMRRKDIPDWDTILRNTKNPRVSIVLNRCNQHELFKILEFLKNYPNIRYVQIRRVSTDTRVEELTPDMVAYEQVYSQIRNIFPLVKTLWADAEIYDIFGMEVVFWRTTKTSVNSLNYFTDGTISDMYFVVEGYKKYSSGNSSNEYDLVRDLAKRTDITIGENDPQLKALEEKIKKEREDITFS